MEFCHALTRHKSWYRLDSIPGRVIPKTWKTVLAACPASCSALTGGCKGTVHVRFWVSGTVDWIKWYSWLNTCRLSWCQGSIPDLVIAKKIVLAAIPASCSTLSGGCKGTVHARRCHWFATSAAFTAKGAAWSRARASGDGRRRSFWTLRGVQKYSINETELSGILIWKHTMGPA